MQFKSRVVKASAYYPRVIKGRKQKANKVFGRREGIRYTSNWPAGAQSSSGKAKRRTTPFRGNKTELAHSSQPRLSCRIVAINEAVVSTSGSLVRGGRAAQVAKLRAGVTDQCSLDWWSSARQIPVRLGAKPKVAPSSMVGGLLSPFPVQPSRLRLPQSRSPHKVKRVQRRRRDETRRQKCVYSGSLGSRVSRLGKGALSTRQTDVPTLPS